MRRNRTRSFHTGQVPAIRNANHHIHVNNRIIGSYSNGQEIICCYWRYANIRRLNNIHCLITRSSLSLFRGRPLVRNLYFPLWSNLLSFWNCCPGWWTPFAIICVNHWGHTRSLQRLSWFNSDTRMFVFKIQPTELRLNYHTSVSPSLI